MTFSNCINKGKTLISPTDQNPSCYSDASTISTKMKLSNSWHLICSRSSSWASSNCLQDDCNATFVHKPVDSKQEIPVHILVCLILWMSMFVMKIWYCNDCIMCKYHYSEIEEVAFLHKPVGYNQKISVHIIVCLILSMPIKIIIRFDNLIIFICTYFLYNRLK